MADSITMPEFCDLIEHIVKPDDILFELGARDGNDSIYFKERLGLNDIYAIEADPKEYALHKSRIESAGITWINRAIYNYDGTTAFYPKSMGSGIHSIRDRGQRYGTECIEIPCSRVSSLCQELGIDHIDIAKIDVEGCSFEALESFGPLIYKLKALHVETESIQFFKDQVLDGAVSKLLESCGFTMIKRTHALIANGYQYDSVWIKQ